MAKVTKATRDTVDVDKEIEKVTSTKKKEKDSKTEKKENKKSKTHKTEEKKKGGILTFFKEVKKEVAKVQWPTRKEMGKYSIATISFVIFFAIFFYVIEIAMAFLKAWV